MAEKGNESVGEWDYRGGVAGITKEGWLERGVEREAEEGVGDTLGDECNVGGTNNAQGTVRVRL